MVLAACPNILYPTQPPAPFLESGVAFDHLAAPDTETGAVPERCVEDVAPGGKDTLLRAYERGSKLMELQQVMGALLSCSSRNIRVPANDVHVASPGVMSNRRAVSVGAKQCADVPAPQYDEAAAAYMEGLRAARSLSHKAKLAYNRSAAFAG